MDTSRVPSRHSNPFVALKGRTQKQARRRKCLARMVGIAGLLSLIWAPVSRADSLGDWLAYLSYLELVASYAQQVETEINTQLAQAQSYVYQAQNLQNAPAADLAQVIAPYQQAIGNYEQFLSAAQSLQAVIGQNEQMLTQRGAEIQTMTNGDATQYWQMEAQLAQQQGGIYQAALQRDQASLQDLASKANALQNAANNLPSTGTVDGLDKLNTTLTTVAEEALNLNRQMAQADLDRNAAATLTQQSLQNQAQERNAVSAQDALDATAAIQRLQEQINTPSGYNQQQIEQNAWNASP